MASYKFKFCIPTSFCFKANVVSVVDGDTIKVSFVSPFSNVGKCEITVRLHGIDAPELKSSDPKEKEAALESMRFVARLLGIQNVKDKKTIKNELKHLGGREVIIKPKNSEIDLKRGRITTMDCFGRLLAEVIVFNTDVNINEALINSGQSKIYKR